MSNAGISKGVENVQIGIHASLVYRARDRGWPLTAHFLGMHARHKGEALHSVGPTLRVSVELAQNLFFRVLLLKMDRVNYYIGLHKFKITTTKWRVFDNFVMEMILDCS